ncbi:carbohydrate-binding protein [Phytohabitans aurantiacus]|uniref:Silent information regulator protein Sir2 n=1 Tax=Phytohabitans aurantiacus TaxID=3016789 RepID=A0ABQ5R869_9ACTN|nr:CBM35 domain-containing protein [Phytohabitans aurantiacus]GLI02575.1 silent information regulator protein Sir2 [Phytohabitans aurantiacus]
MRFKILVAGGAAVVAAGAAGVWVAGSAFAATTRYEAETSPAVCTGTIDSNHSGFSGSGFCNGDNATNAFAQVTATASAAGTATLGVRFANGTTSARAASLIVNGATTQSVSFEGTGAWNTWVTKTLTVNLNAGSNTIRFNPTSSGGLANIDYVDVTTGGTTPTTPPPSSPPPAGNALYVAPGGTDSAAGTQANPTTLTSAITRIAAGGTIYMRGGQYNYSQTITIAQGNNGTSSARKKISAYPGETPVLNFSAQAEDPANRGLAVNGNFWHVYGIIVERAGDNGIFVGGHNNIFERTITRFNRDTGLQLSRMLSSTPRDQWPSNNLILSAESHDNADSDGEDADGFAAKLTVGAGNVFRYAVSHNNIDDGWDLYTYADEGPIGAVTIEDSIAYNNGTLSNGGQAGNGDRNGYKLGGEDVPVNHVVRRSIAFRNGKHGFTYNRNPGTMTISNNLSIDNTERNYSFDAGTSVFRNNTSCRSASGTNDRIVGNTDSSNQFWSGTNGSRCANFSGALGWSFASDGRLVVTLGGRVVTL